MSRGSLTSVMPASGRGSLGVTVNGDGTVGVTPGSGSTITDNGDGTVTVTS